MWFDWRPSIARRVLLVLLFLLFGGLLLYVWCELFTPRWHVGRLRSRFGSLVSRSELRALE